LVAGTKHEATHCGIFSNLLESGGSLPFCPKYLPQHHLESPQPMSETNFHTHIQQQAQYVVPNILRFKFLDNKWEDKRFWTE